MKKEINFFSRIDDTKKDSRVRMGRGAAVLLGAFLCVAAAFAVTLAVMLIHLSGVIGRTAQAKAYVENEENIEKAGEIEKVKQDTLLMKDFLALRDTAAKAMDAVRPFDMGTYNVILANKPQRVILMDIVYGGGSITLRCITTDNMPPADFAESLDKSSAFSYVKYTGFSQNANGQVVFTIVCY